MVSDTSRKPRPLGRGPKVRAAVLAATLDELTEVGYSALTVDNVARRAGVHKTTVYRRWADRDRLLLDALTEQIAADIPVPDTGAIDSDLRALARGLVAWLTSPAGHAALAVLLSDAVRLPEIADVRSRIFHDRVRRATPVITRAIERGELPPSVEPADLIKAVAAPIYFQLLITGEPLDQAVADAAAQNALAVVRNSPAQR